MSNSVKEIYEQYHQRVADGEEGTAKTLLQRMHHALRRFDYNRSARVLDYFRGRPPGGQLLEVGCSDGALLEKLASRVDAVTGIEFSEKAVNLARSRLARMTHARIIQCDLNADFPACDGMDYVLALDVLEHLFQPQIVLARINAALKDGGILIVSVPNAVFLPNRWRMLLGRLPVTGAWGETWDSYHLHLFNHGLLKSLLEQSGFALVKYEALGILPALRRPRLEILCGSVFGVFRKTSAGVGPDKVWLKPNL